MSLLRFLKSRNCPFRGRCKGSETREPDEAEPDESHAPRPANYGRG